MKSSPKGAADTLTTAADFFTETQRHLRDARTVGELEVAAKRLDSEGFDALPAGAREDLAALYSYKLFRITGALLG